MNDNKTLIIDFHSHILPNIDDGSDCVETSLEMLKISHLQGVDILVSATHYYNFTEDIKSFAKRRDEAFHTLKEHIEEDDTDTPKIILAAEVRLFPGLHLDEDIDKLCIEGTKNILIEMPFSDWSDWMYNEIYAIITRGYTPIMAHIERYLGPVSEKEIAEKLLSMDVLVQCNADSFSDWKTKRFIKKLIKQGRLTVIGSDCHNLESRISHIDDAAGFIIKKYGEEYINVIMKNAKYLIKN